VSPGQVAMLCCKVNAVAKHSFVLFGKLSSANAGHSVIRDVPGALERFYRCSIYHRVPDTQQLFVTGEMVRSNAEMLGF
jgi:hypothetical protein